MTNTEAVSPNVTSFDINKAITFNKFFAKVKLSASTRLVLRCLIDCWNPQKGLVFPGQGFISEATGVTLRSVTTSVQQLKDEGLVLTTRKQTHLNYYFTQKFFELLNISYQMRKNCTSRCEKIAYPYIVEQKKNKEVKDKVSFSVFSNERKIDAQNKELNGKHSGGYSSFNRSNGFVDYKKSEFIPPQLLGPTYQKYVPTERLERKSPTDDYETAVKWLSSLGESELKLDFIRKKASDVRAIWGL